MTTEDKTYWCRDAGPNIEKSMQALFYLRKKFPRAGLSVGKPNHYYDCGDYTADRAFLSSQINLDTRLQLDLALDAFYTAWDIAHEHPS